MGFCTRCGANLAELEDAIHRGTAEGAGVHLVRRTEESHVASLAGAGESASAAAAPASDASALAASNAGTARAPDEAVTEAFPRVKRPQAEAREEGATGSSLWHPNAAGRERLGPVQYGGARAPWIRRVGPSAALWFRPFALAGGVLALGAAWLPWIQWDFHFTAFRFPVRFLINGGLGGRSVMVGLVLAVLAGLGVVLSLGRRLSLVRRFVGVLVLAIPALFATAGLAPRDLSQLVHDLGMGAYTAAVGGLLLLFG
jgi:hypothetical protein